MEDTILLLGFIEEKGLVRHRTKSLIQRVRLWFWFEMRQLGQMGIERLKQDVSINKLTSEFLFLDELKTLPPTVKVPNSTMEIYGDF